MAINFLCNSYGTNGKGKYVFISTTSAVTVHSKIDRVFVNNLWENKFQEFGIHFGEHSLSDHTLILVKFNTRSPCNARVPFRFNNSWCTNANYKNVVGQALNINVQGNSLFILINKLKEVKHALKAWQKAIENYQQISGKIS